MSKKEVMGAYGAVYDALARVSKAGRALQAANEQRAQCVKEYDAATQAFSIEKDKASNLMAEDVAATTAKDSQATEINDAVDAVSK
jgi:hypothetical protein